jgi:hypothetical protein
MSDLVIDGVPKFVQPPMVLLEGLQSVTNDSSALAKAPLSSRFATKSSSPGLSSMIIQILYCMGGDRSNSAGSPGTLPDHAHLAPATRSPSWPALPRRKGEEGSK